MEVWDIVSRVISACNPLVCWRFPPRVLGQGGVQGIATGHWIYMAMGVMTILYSIMFFVMRGWFIVDNGVWYWHKNCIARDDAGQLVEETQEEEESKAIANMLLL